VNDPSSINARDLDRALGFIDGTLSAAESERLLSEQPAAERARLVAMRRDSQALRAMPAPGAPEELHEAIMSAAERAELFAGTPRLQRLHDADSNFARTAHAHASHGQHASHASGVVARPWALRWRTLSSAAALFVMAAGVTWAVWPRTLPRANKGSELVQRPEVHGLSVAAAAYTPGPAHAPYAVVLEVEDENDAEAMMRSLANEIPGAHVTCCCRGQCTEVVEGPPLLVGKAGEASELVAIADAPSHQMVIPASELPRVLGTFVSSANGSIDQRRILASTKAPPGSTTVELPIFIVPSPR
jgi:hypothetical protein